ncbi:hypothetical protein GOBAR_DD21242 [Gossypium barbadense]|nr:hypothetical protein GOBAR_DD21242 [Gossypium barbadense]
MMDALLEMMQSSLLVWTTADSKRQGFLGFKEFVFAMQLVSLVQEGHQISHDLLNGDVDFENIRPPVMEGLDTLIMRKKQSSKSSSLESNGSSSNQTSPASQLFSSKSSKKISLSSATSIIDGLKRLKGILPSQQRKRQTLSLWLKASVQDLASRAASRAMAEAAKSISLQIQHINLRFPVEPYLVTFRYRLIF